MLAACTHYLKIQEDAKSTGPQYSNNPREPNEEKDRQTRHLKAMIAAEKEENFEARKGRIVPNGVGSREKALIGNGIEDDHQRRHMQLGMMGEQWREVVWEGKWVCKMQVMTIWTVASYAPPKKALAVAWAKVIPVATEGKGQT